MRARLTVGVVFLLVVAACIGNDSASTTVPAIPSTTTALTPIAERIAFASDRDGNLEVYVMDADGSNQIRLTNNPATNGSPTWVPTP